MTEAALVNLLRGDLSEGGTDQAAVPAVSSPLPHCEGLKSHISAVVGRLESKGRLRPRDANGNPAL